MDSSLWPFIHYFIHRDRERMQPGGEISDVFSDDSQILLLVQDARTQWLIECYTRQYLQEQELAVSRHNDSGFYDDTSSTVDSDEQRTIEQHQ